MGRLPGNSSQRRTKQQNNAGRHAKSKRHSEAEVFRHSLFGIAENIESIVLETFISLLIVQSGSIAIFLLRYV